MPTALETYNANRASQLGLGPSPTSSPQANAVYKASDTAGQAAIRSAGNVVTPTVISGQGARDTFGGLDAKANAVGASVPPPATNTGTDTTTEDIYKKYLGEGTSVPVSPEEQTIKNQLQSLQSRSDANTANQLSTLQQQYEQQRADTVDSQKSTTAGIENALLLGGGARYAPISSSGVISAKQKFDLNTLQELATNTDAKRQAVLEAQSTRDYQNLSKQLELYQNAKEAEQKKVTDLITEAREANKATAAAKVKVQQDISGVLQDAAKNGADKTTLQNISQATTLNEAVMAAGDTLQGGTGIVGEYNAYKRDAASRGLVPLSFDAYQTRDANRKVTLAKAGTSSSGGLFGGTGSSGDSDIGMIAQAIINGNQPPVVTGLYGKTAAVRAELEKRGFNYTKANQDFTATSKLLATLNGAQQTKLRESINQVDESLPLLESMANEWDAGGFPTLNKVQLRAAKEGLLGPKAQSLATRMDAELADLTSELATVYKGGNSSTDESLKLAATQLNSSWSKQTLLDAIDLAKKNIQYRKNSFNLTTGGITDSKYNPIDTAGADILREQQSAKTSIDSYLSSADAQTKRNIAAMYKTSGADDIKVLKYLQQRGLIK